MARFWLLSTCQEKTRPDGSLHWTTWFFPCYGPQRLRNPQLLSVGSNSATTCDWLSRFPIVSLIKYTHNGSEWDDSTLTSATILFAHASVSKGALPRFLRFFAPEVVEESSIGSFCSDWSWYCSKKSGSFHCACAFLSSNLHSRPHSRFRSSGRIVSVEKTVKFLMFCEERIECQYALSLKHLLATGSYLQKLL